MMRSHLTEAQAAAIRAARLRDLVEELEARLAPICVETPIATFTEMVMRIARVKLACEPTPLQTSRPARATRADTRPVHGSLEESDLEICRPAITPIRD